MARIISIPLDEDAIAHNIVTDEELRILIPTNEPVPER